LDGTSGWLASISYRPAKPWDALAERSELGGGALAALGILHPLRPIITFGAMVIAHPTSMLASRSGLPKAVQNC